MALSVKQLASIPESELKQRILSAAGVEVPPQAVSSQFDLPHVSLYHWDGGEDEPIFVVREGSQTRLERGSAALKICNVPASTPSGQALRRYLRRWGWLPEKERGLGLNSDLRSSYERSESPSRPSTSQAKGSD